MIQPQLFFDTLKSLDVEFFVGVPDSLLKNICSYITDNAPATAHTIAANEGGAVGLAMGYHLATGKIPLVYLQNSGVGNITNPLMSLADSEVYGIPMLIMIGWRGEPGVKDEPQHVKQGRVTIAQLEAMEIDYLIIDQDSADYPQQIKQALDQISKTGQQFALVIKKNTFAPYKSTSPAEKQYPLSREEALTTLLPYINSTCPIVATTGKASRELFEYRRAADQNPGQDFLTVGGMGHTAQIALGVAKHYPHQVFCIDGDGSVLMHMGSLPIIAASGVTNLKHIVINNGAHDSVGGQPTVGFAVDFCAIASASGYPVTMRATTKDDITRCMQTLLTNQVLTFLEIRVNKGSRADLGRPTHTPQQTKQQFMACLQEQRTR